MIRLAYRHGLRAKELVELPWTRVNLDEAVISIKRAKGGKDGGDPLHGDDVRSLRGLSARFSGLQRGCGLSSSMARKAG
jgi:site-specific recombinase XerC